MRRRSRWAVTVLAAFTAAVATTPQASAQVAGRTTLETTIAAGDGAFKLLGQAPGEPFVTRGEGIGQPQAGRGARRLSLLYFGQLSDFQLADEESPSRVEIADAGGGPVSAAWRPMEAFGPQTVDAAVRQMNAFVAASPVQGSDGSRARMAFAITTGDSADNQQLNETQWVVRLLDGGMLNPNSGVPGTCGTDEAEAARYTGVADLDDYVVPTADYYDPDMPQGAWSAFPAYPGLLDRAQAPFETAGLDVPVYVTFGNHDALAQGNQAANQSFEAIGTGCTKPTSGSGVLAPVPSDPDRRYVSKKEYKDLHRTPGSPTAHGFGLIDPAVEAESAGAAGYYAWNPQPGFRFIAVDTVSEGGVTPVSAEGNVDDPQFRWLEDQLKQATARDDLVFLFSHHAIQSLNAAVPDESAPACTGPDSHGHDVNPGCDLDPRTSTPIHLADDLTALVLKYSHVVAWVAGHSHVNSVDPFKAPGGGGFWGIRVAAEIDWPQQSRLLEVMDNRDGTLSIFGTILDQAAPAAAPAAGTPAGAFSPDQLASLSRLFAANDPQGGVGTGAGDPKDRNVELVVREPRRNPIDPTSIGGGGGGTGQGGGGNGKPRRCASLRGRLEGKRLHRARLGARRRSVRRRYPSRTTRRRKDVFCLADGRSVRVAYRRGRAALILTSSTKFRARGIRPGMRTRRLRGRARRVFRRFFVARGRRATLVFRVRRGRVREVGVAQRRLTASRASTRRLLKRF